ncbi:MAG TPA: DUF3014 domain-containing protein [Giesbergeria sp.]|nr:DUF3014 domain-containing protein [Giesbergeria sp.]
MQEPERSTLNPPQESSRWGLVVVVLVLLAGAGGAWWWQQAQTPLVTPAAPPAAASAPPVAVEPPALPASEPASGPQNPVEALAPPDAALPTLAGSDDPIAQALGDLLGARDMAAFLQMDGLVRRVVATVDNLGREHTPARLWPVNPTPERFAVVGSGPVQTIGLDNAARYGALVRWIESVDMERAVALYARLYPLFQQAYEELGYPGRYFNDRLVAVIDHLLQAPEPASPVAVKLTEVKGDVPSTRPWVRYEFADPQLQSLSSGQKIMVRVGLENERRLKVRLKALRALVATGAAAKAKP